MLYNQWMSEEIHEIKPSNRIKKPSAGQRKLVFVKL